MEFDKLLHIGKYEFGVFKRKIFLKVFHHYAESGELFENESEALSCNLPNKYSILSEITDEYKINGKFEFLINYPNESRYFRWRQLNNPVEELEVENISTAEGFESIYPSDLPNKWGGLVRTNITYEGKISSLLDGNPGSDFWYFAIGMYKDNTWESYGFPAYQEDLPTNYTSLWMRVPEPYNHFITCENQKQSIIGESSYLFFISLIHYSK